MVSILESKNLPFDFKSLTVIECMATSMVWIPSQKLLIVFEFQERKVLFLQHGIVTFAIEGMEVDAIYGKSLKLFCSDNIADE